MSLPQQEFFSLRITARRIFFCQVSFAGIFFWGILTPPPVISNGRSLINTYSWFLSFKNSLLSVTPECGVAYKTT